MVNKETRDNISEWVLDYNGTFSCADFKAAFPNATINEAQFKHLYKETYLNTMKAYTGRSEDLIKIMMKPFIKGDIVKGSIMMDSIKLVNGTIVCEKYGENVKSLSTLLDMSNNAHLVSIKEVMTVRSKLTHDIVCKVFEIKKNNPSNTMYFVINENGAHFRKGYACINDMYFSSVSLNKKYENVA